VVREVGMDIPARRRGNIREFSHKVKEVITGKIFFSNTISYN